MWSEILLLLRFEMVLVLGIFVLLFLKIGNAGLSNNTVMTVVNVLLFAGILVGLIIPDSDQAFGDMFYTNSLIQIEEILSKN